MSKFAKCLLRPSYLLLLLHDLLIVKYYIATVFYFLHLSSILVCDFRHKQVMTYLMHFGTCVGQKESRQITPIRRKFQKLFQKAQNQTYAVLPSDKHSTIYCLLYPI